MFWGWIPGSIGESNKLLIILGAIFLSYIKIINWRVMVGAVLGLIGTALITNFFSPYSSNSMFTIPPHYHLVMGSFLFGIVFMATEPVTAASTNKGRWIYGLSIGVIAVLIRVVNPAFPEGMMLAILFANLLAPAIDFAVTSRQTSKRMQRYNS